VRAAYESFKKATELEPDFALASSELARYRVVHQRTDGT
jgi:hypothetical protein